MSPGIGFERDGEEKKNVIVSPVGNLG